MKNVVKNLKTLTYRSSTLMFVLAFLVLPSLAKANIINVIANANGGYMPGGTSTIMFDVTFDSNTAESADFIEFSIAGMASGVSFAHGLPSPSPYQGCGSNRGMEMTGNGPGWGTPMMMGGGSGCGAFLPAGTYSFGIEIDAMSTFTGPLDIQVSVVGDGTGEMAPSVETAIVTVQPVVCTIVCPQNVSVTASGSDCSFNVNVPAPTLNGMCGTAPAGVSMSFPVGDTEVVYDATDANGNPISCVTIVTVIDDEDPLILGVSNITEELAAGECGLEIPVNFTVTENCIDPERLITQSLDLNTFDQGFNCVGGSTSYIRVFDADDEDIDTELNIEEITFGVLEAFGNPFITVNVYDVTGSSISFDNFELIATANDILPDITNALYSIPVSAVIERETTFAVEIVVPGSQFNGVIVAMNQGGETATSYIASDFCGAPEPVDIATLGFGDFATVMAVGGFETSYLLVPEPGSALLGDIAPIGTTAVNYLAIDASGNEANIDFTVTVEEFSDPISAIACNDDIQISLDDSCEAIVTAAQVLEGGPYACFDTYLVEIEDENGDFIGNVVNADHIGQILRVRVVSPEGNSCWGNLVVEDKNPVPLDCLEISTSCTGNLFPGSPISPTVTFPTTLTPFNTEISDDASSSNVLTFNVRGLERSIVEGVSVRLNIEHTSVSDLNASITGPDGTTVTLFTAPGTDCPEDNIQITLDDDAFNNYGDLQMTCELDMPAISGAFQPQQPLGTFAGQDPNGDWFITITDNNTMDGGTILAAELIIAQSGGIVSFPTMNDVTFQTETNNTFTVMGIDACGLATLSFNDDIIDQDCSSPYTQIIERRWNAVDENGNETPGGCVQNIFVLRNGLSSLTFPPNFDGIQMPSLSCTDFADEVPSIDVTGTLTGDFCSTVQIFPHTDTRLDICEGSYKIVRNFQLLEWCSGEVIEHTQVIKVEDVEGPEFDPILDTTISAGEFQCAADHFVAMPEILFDCSDEFSFEVFHRPAFSTGEPVEDTLYFDDNVFNVNGGAIIRDLPFGNTWIQVRVHDECGNFSDDYYTLTIDDQVNPIAVCDEFTNVAIGGDGFAEVFSETFDDGSIDNCGIRDFQVRKVTNSCSMGTSSFSESIFFCCDEVGTNVMVEFQVTDFAGNSNTCMVEVSVQDKLPPFITFCPEDITLDCQADFQNLEVTGEPEYIDNCGVISVNFEDDENIDQCGAGTVRRTWTVEDREGFKATCVQVITLVDPEPFEENDITWPRDFEATSCDSDLLPENLPVAFAFPRFDDDNCSLVATTYEDRVFTFVDSSCVKILREWTVIDWCTFDDTDPDNDEGLFTWLQVIKLNNTIAPEITNCMDTEIDIFGECEGDVMFTIEAEDDCTPTDELVYFYQIDLFSDGLDILDFSLTGNTATINRELPIGEHTVNWTVEDRCGNVTFCEMVLTVVDGKKPTPYCRSTITTVVMNNNGMISIWANDFDLGSTDNCTPQEELLISFSANVNDTNRTITCDDLINGGETEIAFEIWVTDNAGNQDFCTIGLIVQDSQDNVCPGSGGGSLVSIGGSVFTENSNRLRGANVTVTSPTLEVNRTDETDSNGGYRVNSLPTGPGYFVNAEKNDDVHNGVSTLDLVLIQRHLLGLQPLDSPYKVIASDVNDDERINASDLLQLRKVILGVIAEFPDGQQSWRFVPEGETFADIEDPFGYNETINIGNLQSSSLDNDLIAIKIGDVNNSATANLTGNVVTTRNNPTILFEIENKSVEEFSTVEIPVFASEELSVTGLQFEMIMNDAEFVEVIPGLLNIEEENTRWDGTSLAVSYADIDAVETELDEPLFTLVLEMKKDMNIVEALSMYSDGLVAEMYDDQLNTINIEMDTRSNEDASTFAVYQNYPNPFLESTEIKFELPTASNAVLTVTDITGRVIYKIANDYNAGLNTIRIDSRDLSATGLIYYTIQAGEYRDTKKMINVR